MAVKMCLQYQVPTETKPNIDFVGLRWVRL